MQNKVAGRARRIVRAILKRWGGTKLKKHMWDIEFREGVWNYLDGIPSDDPNQRDPILYLVDRYAFGGTVLDLGCGSGSTGFDLRDNHVGYVGVDISEVAIRKAEATLGRDRTDAHKKQYIAADITTFVPKTYFSVILFRESLYYVQRHRIGPMLSRYTAFLGAKGVFIVRLHDRFKYKYIVDLIHEQYLVVETNVPEAGKTIMLVFSPPPTES